MRVTMALLAAHPATGYGWPVRKIVSHRLAPLVVAAILTALSYSNSLKGEFVFDDKILVEDAEHIRSLSSIPAMVSQMSSSEGIGYRPVRAISYMLDHQIWKLEPLGYHLTNVILHILVCLLLYHLARRLGLSRSASLAGMALFAVHPVHTESVTYISGRRDLLFSAFYLGAMLAYIHGVLSKSRLLVLATLPLYALGLFSKEQAITLPVVLYIWELLLGRKDEPWLRRLYRPLTAQPVLWGIIIAGAVAFFVYRGIVLPRTFQLDWWGGSPTTNFATVLAIHLRYLVVQVWPTNLLADYTLHAFPLAGSFLDVRTVMGLLILLASLTVAVLKARTWPLLSLSILSYWVLLLPVSQIIPHHELAAEHHLYLASALICFGAGHAASVAYEHRPRAAASVLVLLLVTMIVLTVQRNRVWQTEETLWNDTVEKAPRCGRALLNLGVIHVEKGDLDAGEKLLRWSIEATDYARAHAYLGRVLTMRGDFQEADRILSAAYHRFPDQLHVVRFYAHNLLKQDRGTEARTVLVRGVEKWPRNADMHYLLGGAHLMTGDPDACLEQNLEVLRLDPSHVDARLVAVALARELGRSSLAADLEAGKTP